MPYPNVREYVKITGTGDFPLAGALPSYERVGQQYNTNDTFHYRIDHTTENEWEEGTGTYNEATNVVARTTVTASSNSGNKVSFSAGTKIIEIGPRVQIPVHNSDPSGTREGELIYSNGTLKINDGSSLAEVGGGGSDPVVESLGAGSGDPGNPVRWDAASTLILVVPTSGSDRYGVPAAGTFANGDTVKVINNGGTANAYINTGPLWALLGVNKCAILTHYDGDWFADNY